jgi:hypothetical protein
VDKNIQVKSKILYHKYDFLTEIEKLDLELNKFEVSLYNHCNYFYKEYF